MLGTADLKRLLPLPMASGHCRPPRLGTMGVPPRAVETLNVQDVPTPLRW